MVRAGIRYFLSILATVVFGGSALAAGDLPELVPAGKLPLAVQTAHADCAGPEDSVSLAAFTFGSTVVYLVGCPRQPVSSWPESLAPRYDLDVPVATPVRAYLVRGKDATHAEPIDFPVRLAKGSYGKAGTLPISATVERDAKADQAKAVPWIEALWKPANRPDMCKIIGTWRIVKGKAELWRWREARTCTDDGPQYRTVFNRHPPKLAVAE